MDWDSDYLMISGIQHFLFCERQWCLIHSEGIWSENILTVRGTNVHKNVDDRMFRELRNGRITLRSVPLISNKLQFYGVSDAIELIPDPMGIPISGHRGTYQPYPVEYKLGKPKKDRCDEAQLCLQVLCLEEMMGCNIPTASLFYNGIKRRSTVEMTEELRELTIKAALKMHHLMKTGETIEPIFEKKCLQCSLHNDCLPKALSKNRSVNSYIQRMIHEKTT
ncbi:CRISPR-associated RecB family exonuclease Cas4 [Clostridiaceae bacterium JG1575]|nr:CRISPR-associated RecB family exonuclease Cas4 [Clostridiaceae bacterium JG1575]